MYQFNVFPIFSFSSVSSRPILTSDMNQLSLKKNRFSLVRNGPADFFILSFYLILFNQANIFPIGQDFCILLVQSCKTDVCYLRTGRPTSVFDILCWKVSVDICGL